MLITGRTSLEVRDVVILDCSGKMNGVNDFLYSLNNAVNQYARDIRFIITLGGIENINPGAAYVALKRIKEARRVKVVTDNKYVRTSVHGYISEEEALEAYGREEYKKKRPGPDENISGGPG